MHPCTNEDYEKFYPASGSSKPRIEAAKKNGGLLCLDSLDIKNQKIKRKLFGSHDSQPNRTLVIMLRPCIPEQLTEKNKHLEDKKCLADYNNQASLDERYKKSL